MCTYAHRMNSLKLMCSQRDDVGTLPVARWTHRILIARHCQACNIHVQVPSREVQRIRKLKWPISDWFRVLTRRSEQFCSGLVFEVDRKRVDVGDTECAKEACEDSVAM